MRVYYNVLTLLLYVCTVIAGHYIRYKGDHLIQTTMHIRIYMGKYLGFHDHGHYTKVTLNPGYCNRGSTVSKSIDAVPSKNQALSVKPLKHVVIINCAKYCMQTQ